MGLAQARPNKIMLHKNLELNHVALSCNQAEDNLQNSLHTLESMHKFPRMLCTGATTYIYPSGTATAAPIEICIPGGTNRDMHSGRSLDTYIGTVEEEEPNRSNPRSSSNGKSAGRGLCLEEASDGMYMCRRDLAVEGTWA